jgi:DNA invertase Pin-like site-specific DNA recombinase
MHALVTPMDRRAAARARIAAFPPTSRQFDNRVQVLRQIAERRGWQVVEQYSDAGISGGKGRDGRAGVDQMLKDASRRKFDVIIAWASHGRVR